jgi:hypothetical protein
LDCEEDKLLFTVNSKRIIMFYWLSIDLKLLIITVVDAD